MCYQKRQFFLYPLDSYATNIPEDIFIIPTEDIHEK